MFHPHLHCIVPGGGLDPGHTRWIATRPDFFLPVRVPLPGLPRQAPGQAPAALARGPISLGLDATLPRLLKRAAAQSWVVYAKPPFAGPEQVLAYLARYTHRIAISNDRLVSLHEGRVTFRWTDRAHGNAPRLATLDAATFLRRFLLHVLPDRFVRIRHYGWLANCTRQPLLPTVQALLTPSATSATPARPAAPEPWEATVLRLTGSDVAALRVAGLVDSSSSKRCRRRPSRARSLSE